MAILENQFFIVSTEEESGVFNIFSKDENCFLLKSNKISVTGRYPSGRKFLLDIDLANGSKRSSNDSTSLNTLKFFGINEKLGLGWEVHFKFDESNLVFLWQVLIKNLSGEPVFIDKLTMLKPRSLAQSNLAFCSQENPADFRFYSNGWQSWSFTGAYSGGDRMRKSRLGLLQEPIVLNPGTPTFYKKGLFSSDFFAFIGEAANQKGIVLGFLSQEQHFGTICASLHELPQIEIWANGDGTRLLQNESMITDWAALCTCSLDNADSISPYLHAVSKYHGIDTISEPMTGWCSWYYYYQNISHSIIETNLDVLTDIKHDIPFYLFQIDDGYQKQVGDWLEFNDKFPDGVRDIAKKTCRNGFTPGIWTAPFILHPKSQIVKEHPEWILRKQNKRPVRAGFVWNDLGMALDLTVPGVLEHVREVIDTAVNEWGFQYLKLDFLYAAALKGNYYDDTKTRAQVLRLGIETIRETAGEDTELLGCGAPLGSVLGLVDSMRIGADVSGSWKPSYFNINFLFKNEPHMPCAENSINNIITRSFLHNRWWVNDPDCLLVREKSDLSLAEVRSLATVIALTGGAVLLSDNLTTLSKERLRIVKVLVPPINKRAKVIDWMASGKPSRMRVDLEGAVGKWQIVSFSNWGNAPINKSLQAEDFGLPKGTYYVSSFWESQSWECGKNTPIYEGIVQPHETILLSVRQYSQESIFFIGSNLHISQGLEIEKMTFSKNEIHFQFSNDRHLEGFIDLLLPKVPKKSVLNNSAIEYIPKGRNIYRFKIEGDPGLLTISY
jgi:alpha-galactosidase